MTTPRDEPPRDAWLREALRHAPDADAAPPAELSAAILRQARDTVKAAARPAVSSHPLLQWWSWLARPPVAAGFATVMVATLVGVMWWDQPLDRTLPPPAASAEPSAAPASVTPPLAPAAAPPRADDAKSATLAEKAAPRVPASRTAPPPPAPAPERERQAAPTDRAPADAAGELRTSGANSAPPPPAAPAPSPTPAPAATAETAAKRALAATRDEAATQRSAPAQALAKAAPTTETPATDQPERWTWQRDGADLQPMTPALQRWLVQLDRAARWRPADAASPADGPVLQLRRDGLLRATLQVGANAAWLTRTDGPPLTAPLSPEVAASLRAALIAATP